MIKRNSISGSKKGYLAESLQIVIVLFIFGLLAIITYNIFTDLNTDIQASDDISASGKELADSLHSRYPATMDGAFLLIFVLLWILLLVAIWFYESNPLFMIIVIVVLIFVLIAAGMLSNFWEDFSIDADFSYQDNFPSTYFILNNFLIVMSTLFISVIATMYMKGRG
jgi:4-hydroxybenzoate polyprenyltransferase